VARARQLKPGFFKNEDLARCTPWARLMFEGLWTLGDREGRLEDRPTYIKGEVFPHDNVDAEALLSELADLKDHFSRPAAIVRYQVGECKYIQIINFTKHQNPHIKEPASTIPAPDSHGTGTRRARGKNHASTGRAPGEHRASRASSLFPLPSSLTVDSMGVRGNPASEPEFPPDEVQDETQPPTPKPGRFTPPTIEEVQAHIAEKGYTFSAEAFVAYYQTRGWKLKGGELMKDWPAACVTWQLRETPKTQPAAKKEPTCRDCKKPLTKAETMEGLTCRACRADHGV
jgi:hypothetical protein